MTQSDFPSNNSSYDAVCAALFGRLADDTLTGRMQPVAPSLDRIRKLMSFADDPQLSYPTILVSGTNGKTTTTRMITSLLRARGLHTGTVVSPHLERINERVLWDGDPLSDERFAEAVSEVLRLELLAEKDLPTFFELMAAVAFTFFADAAIDVAVVEVGIEGKYDAHNVCEPSVSVATNVDLDHTAYLGPTRAHIAAEMASAARPDGVLVLGETDPDLIPIFRDAAPGLLLLRGEDFECEDQVVAVGGRSIMLRTPLATYPEIYLPLHGAHQADNAAAALVATEAFFGEALDPDVVAEGFATVTSPGRMEVMSRRPLVLLDGAHNPAGAAALGLALDEEFSAIDRRIAVYGTVTGRNPAVFAESLGLETFDEVLVVTPPTSRAANAKEVAAELESVGVSARPVDSLERALNEAIDAADPNDMVLVTGSLYLVGAARTILRP